MSAPTVTITVDASSVLHEVSDDYLSFTMDTNCLHWWPLFEREVWNDQLTRALARHLGPATLRFGGSTQDHAIYDFGELGREVSDNCSPPLWPSITQSCVHLDAARLGMIDDFLTDVGWDFIFGANVGTARTNDDSWDPRQFEDLLRFAIKAGINFLGFELGNEPDLLCKSPVTGVRYICGKPPPGAEWPKIHAVSPQQLAKDFGVFQEVTSRYYPSAMVIGDDSAYDIKRYAAPFLQALSRPLDVFTWHHYYGPGGNRPHALNITDFSHPATLDSIMVRGEVAREVHEQYGRGAKLFIGETSSTYGGGTPNASTSFAAGFLWLDKLGLAPLLGNTAVFRQTFAHSQYSIIGRWEPTVGGALKYEALPNPDYWISLLWRRLIGTRVLGTGFAAGREVRSYAFCAARPSAPGGSLAVVLLNTREEEQDLQLELQDHPLGNNRSSARRGTELGPADVYWLTSGNGRLDTPDVRLNGRLLELVDRRTGELPQLEAARVQAGEAIRMPPRSYGFVVLPEARALACSPLDSDGGATLVA